MGGPFGYGYYDDVTPGAFYFGGVSGWVLQTYFDFTDAMPDPSVWVIPDTCINAPNCTLA